MPPLLPADAPLARGHEVHHLLDERRVCVHLPTAFAVVGRAMGTYPEPQGDPDL